MKRLAPGKSGDSTAFVCVCGTPATGILSDITASGRDLLLFASRAPKLTVSGPPLKNPPNPLDIPARAPWIEAMKVRNSLKSLRGRHRDNRLVRRKGRVYVINKTQKRFKARQG